MASPSSHRDGAQAQRDKHVDTRQHLGGNIPWHLTKALTDSYQAPFIRDVHESAVKTCDAYNTDD
jgi:hypothetical protein